MHSFALLILASATPAFTKPGDGGWAAAYAKADAALAKLSTNEKITIVVGAPSGGQPGHCIGETAAVPSIGYPQFCVLDGPLAVHAANATVFPAGIHVASTWDPSLMYARGQALGAESKSAGVHVLFGPSAGPLGKIPAAGRNWEGFSPDPYLAGSSMTSTIKGMQGAGVQACAKHLIDYEQDTKRNYISSNVDDRTNHELYLWPFADAVRANVTSVMCSTNLVNHTLACQNGAVLQGLLKDELDFQGFVVSDWGAHNSTADAVNAGLDMSMPKDTENRFGVQRDSLADAVSSGKVSSTRLDEMVRRTLAAWYFVGQDTGYPPWTGSVPQVPPSHRELARTIAREGIVLLKNDGALPLQRSARLAIIGEDAVTGNGKDKGTLVVGGGSGSWPGFDKPMPPGSFVAPLDAIIRMGIVVANSTTNDPSAGAGAASAAETAVVFVKSFSGENNDRKNLNPDNNGNDLVTAVSKAGKPIVVVIHSVGPLVLETIVALPNVKAIVWAGVPGQESGNALVDVLYGQTNPSGKLPYTIAKSEGDYGTVILGSQDDDKFPVDNFPEGLYVDYRRFDLKTITPRFEFGFGLSYTTFDYANLSTAYVGTANGTESSAPGGPPSLYDTVATISAVVRNNGTTTGAEVSQLYVGLPPSAPATPARQLRGFRKVTLERGRDATVTFSLRRKDLSYWDVKSQKWVIPSGTFRVFVGASSRDIRLSGSLSTVPTMDAYSTIQAEAHTSSSGTQLEATSDVDGGDNVGWIHNGDWLGYRGIDFGSQGATTFTARIASGAERGANGTMLVALDSPTSKPICSFAVANTGGWQTWTSRSTSIDRVIGNHDVYLAFASGQPSGFMNVNWVKFSS